jgi:small-conductance mechanosensitive channel
MEFLERTLFTIDNLDISLLILVKFIFPVVIAVIISRLIIRFLKKKAVRVWEHLGKSRYLLVVLIKLTLIIAALSLGFSLTGIDRTLFDYAYSLVFKPFITIGSTPVSITSILLLIIIISLSIIISRYIRKILNQDIYPRAGIDIGLRNVIDTFLKYFITGTGVIIGLQVNGINLSVFATIGAALMVGVGFGLQNIASNFISGIVILVERHIKVGDYIEVNNIYGSVEQIKARSTHIKTRDNIIIIVPNSKFISENVINWSHNDLKTMIKAPVGVSYGSDVKKVRDILLQIAIEHEKILNEPAPEVLLEEFDNSSINMALEMWTSDPKHRFEIISEINFEIVNRFRENGVVIPFPQIDVHMRD